MLLAMEPRTVDRAHLIKAKVSIGALKAKGEGQLILSDVHHNIRGQIWTH